MGPGLAAPARATKAAEVARRGRACPRDTCFRTSYKTSQNIFPNAHCKLAGGGGVASSCIPDVKQPRPPGGSRRTVVLSNGLARLLLSRPLWTLDQVIFYFFGMGAKQPDRHRGRLVITSPLPVLGVLVSKERKRSDVSSMYGSV